MILGLGGTSASLTTILKVSGKRNSILRVGAGNVA